MSIKKNLAYFTPIFFEISTLKGDVSVNIFHFTKFFSTVCEKRLIYSIFMPVRLGDISNLIVDTHLKFGNVNQKKLGMNNTYFFSKCHL